MPEPAPPLTAITNSNRASRRHFLSGAALGAMTTAAAGIGAFAYRRSLNRLARNVANSSGSIDEEFLAAATEIMERHDAQTKTQVAELKAKYEHPVLGKFDVWSQIERLAQCIDVTDDQLGGASQLLHVQQTVAAMKKSQIN